MDGEVIAAVSTAPGRGAIGIVRLSGRDIGPVVRRLFRAEHPDSDLKDRRPHLGVYLDEHGRILDTGLLLWMAGPRSYTGEDVVECHCHGNPWILRRVLEAALAAGSRLAEPGEFTKRAYLNGRMDLIQADAVIQVINADSEESLQAARRLLGGELSSRIGLVRDGVLDALKTLEAAIDFPEEELESDEAEVGERLGVVLEELDALVGSFLAGSRARSGAVVAIGGRPNVGKSSLFNRLLGYGRSIVSTVAGTTRDLVESSVELGGVSVRLQDTAGIREPSDAVEEMGVGVARGALESADVVMWVVDGSRGVEEADVMQASALRGGGVAWLGVKNKSDLGLDPGWDGVEGEWSAVSALDGSGVSELRERIGELVGLGSFSEKLMLTSRWQKEILERVLCRVKAGELCHANGLSSEAVAFELYEALEGLDLITGERGREEVIERVFSEFCIGK